MKKIWFALMACAALLIIIAVLVSISDASTTAPRPNSIGAVTEYSNPYTYLLALPVDGQIFEDKYTSLTLQPYGSAAFYKVTILFCGDVSGVLEGKGGPMVFTYRVQASRLYQGAACHDLLSAFEVTAK
jgi:hypothetical protein